MRNLELVRVRCIPCGESQHSSRWGQPCAECGFNTFRVELDRSPSKIDLDDLADTLFVRAVAGMLGDEDVLCGSPSPRPKAGDAAFCDEVSAQEIAEFLGSTGDARLKLYIGWKRRERMSGLGEGEGTCARCGASFKVYDNEWNRAGLCSKACFHAHSRSTRKTE